MSRVAIMIDQLFEDAKTRGSVSKNEKGEDVVHFNAQIILAGGANIGVGEVAWVKREAGILALRSAVSNPKDPTELIATETYFDVADVQSVSVRVATATTKKSSILSI